MTDLAARPGVFPLPLCGLPRQPTSASRRSWQRHGNVVAATNLANCTISALNELAVSFSDRERPFHLNPNANLNHFNHAEARNPHDTTPITATQRRLLAHVYRCATRTLRRRGSPDSTSDDPLFDSKFLSTHLRSADLDAYISRPTSAVAPIEADRVSLPSDAAAVPLMTILPPSLAREYASPAGLLLPRAERKRAPRTRLCGAQPEWAKLVRRMAAIGMIDFTTAPEVVSGIFCVAKDGGEKLRLIMDARPVNVMFVDPVPVKLPTPDLTAAITTDPSRPLYAAKVDLDNFFYRLEMPAAWWPYFALPPVAAADVGVAARFGDAVVYPVCKRLPMGWSHSPRLAQAAHEYVIDTFTGLRPQDRICADNDTVVDRERHQEYIDDLMLFDYDPERLAATQRRYIDAVRRVGLVVKDSKVVLPSADGVVCLGLEVHGVDHTVGASVAKLDALRADTRRLLAAGACSDLTSSADGRGRRWRAGRRCRCSTRCTASSSARRAARSRCGALPRVSCCS